MTATTTIRRKPPRLCVRSVEFRANGEAGDGRTLEGYAAVFGDPTSINSLSEGTFNEQIVRGAFKKTLRDRTPVLQFDHGQDLRTGSVPIGSIEEMREDDTGLFVRAGLFDNPVVEPIRQAIEGRAINGMSFRFETMRDEWRDNAGKVIKGNELQTLLWNPGERGPLQRTVREVKLFELGPVVFPAYQGTSVGVRSILAELEEEERESLIRELAEELRDSDESDAAAEDGTSDETDAPPVKGTRLIDPREVLAGALLGRAKSR